jgi:hypothetical protein
LRKEPNLSVVSGIERHRHVVDHHQGSSRAACIQSTLEMRSAGIAEAADSLVIVPALWVSLGKFPSVHFEDVHFHSQAMRREL